MDMSVEMRGGERLSLLVLRGGGRNGWQNYTSGVASGEKMQHSVNVGGVTNVPELELKVKIFLNTFNL